jgi:hypothetical protein
MYNLVFAHPKSQLLALLLYGIVAEVKAADTFECAISSIRLTAPRVPIGLEKFR